MKRLLFYFLKFLAFITRSVSMKWYMTLTVAAHKVVGVKFSGMPEYIEPDCYLDPSGGLNIGENSVISTKVIILTHDWSFLKRITNHAPDNYTQKAFKSVNLGANSFLGAGSILLPGTTIGHHCIIGAGAVVKGTIPDFSIVIGNPCKIIGDTRNNNNHLHQ
ncbi:acyltransferase [uncultured Duncaniella sp.]|uniref:acyltransferase n=1 Tax=uncultured Duncaniella sp. TaxID=2768039 RepID=UPI00260C811E|nr:acyltransferase [uncultured Duncaniella sp.]